MSTAPESMPVTAPAPHAVTSRLLFSGRVQGVGFRPFVYRMARDHDISGYVRNCDAVIEVIAQGSAERVEDFIEDLLRLAPDPAAPRLALREPAPPVIGHAFRIEQSTAAGVADVHLQVDQSVCDACLRELFDPHNRRYRHPFISCTQCGPRYTVLNALPYDRANTSMAPFALCGACDAEYRDPRDRRFHAQTQACGDCGPALDFIAPGIAVGGNDAALAATLRILRAGGIVAVKGTGGYHLMCDAGSDAAVSRLRARKCRPDKPFATMFPSRGPDGLGVVHVHAQVTPDEARLLLHPSRPVVLMARRPDSTLSRWIAPGLRELGVMLPYSPLHHLLLHDFGQPLVATSANVSGEPVLTDPAEAATRLANIADAFLHHNRVIARPADDSVYRVAQSAPRPLRIGRGVAPLELDLPVALARPVLAVGGHTKNTIALGWEKRAVISPHIGDLGALRSRRQFEQTVAELQRLYRVDAAVIACDAHPDYASTRWAMRAGKPLVPVWHHHAHANTVAAEFPLEERWLVFTWDGTGYGEDGTFWGGEALLGAPGQWRRVASMRRFRLPGGDAAGRAPWRSASALCWETGTHWHHAPPEAAALHAAYRRRINAPDTSAVGRLFDAAAALTGLVSMNSYDGHGPMLLEAAATGTVSTPLTLPIALDGDDVLRSDWAPLVPMLLDAERTVAERAACFHSTLATAATDQATALRERHGDFAIGLAGGVFQNRMLMEHVVALCAARGFRVHVPTRVPLNDGGLAFGQLVQSAFCV